MRNIFVAWVISLSITSAFSQQAEKKTMSLYSLDAQYSQEFVLGGYVQVREWALQGDKMNLKDLGMTSYPVVQFHVEKRLKKGKSFGLTYDHHFMRGHATFDRDITYNGTIINGRNGIDVSPTRYYRVSAIYSGIILSKPRLTLRYTGALVVDHITFYLDGEVTASSPKHEVLEGFGRQAFPYPVLGLQSKIDIGNSNSIDVELLGTYIPKFKSFYTEGGNVYLQYNNFESGLSYLRTISNFELALGTRFRWMHLFQESKEDTNILTTVTAGPFIKVGYRF